MVCSASPLAPGAEAGPIKPDVKEPEAKEEVKVCSVHGERWEDPYAWMKDDNWQQVLREPHLLRQVKPVSMHSTKEEGVKARDTERI